MDDPLGAPDDAASAAVGRASLAAQLRQLEDFAARAVSEGDTVPPQATEMIAHLREIVQALDGLTRSMAERPSHGVDATDQRSPPARTDDAP
jgi:uncharacterized membrane protein YccC